MRALRIMDTYKNFYKTFLQEMPWQVNGGNDFEAQHEMLRELLSDSPPPEKLSNNVFKLVTGNQLTFWVGDVEAHNVALIVDTEVNGNFCKVTLTSKNPLIKPGTPPYASDLYFIIKKDLANTNLVLSSDSMMSNDAINLWSRLVKQGSHIAVYDTQASKYVLNSIKSAEELSQYVGDHTDSKYVFVLSETKELARGAAHSVALMELKRKSGYPLQQLFEKIKLDIDNKFK